VAALAQSLVAWLDGLDDRGYTLPRHRDWVLRQNKWRAGRHGLDTELLADESGRLEPARQAIVDLVEEVAPTAHRLGCDDELAFVGTMLEVGPSYVRQRAVAGPGAEGCEELRPVVDLLVREMATDRLGG
jgi:carboxylate-amine ligase